MNNPHRVAISLACVDCGARNYRTTRKPTQTRSLELKKYCNTCKKHTVHRETK